MGLAVTILTDIVHIGVYYTTSEGLYERSARDTFRFSAGMAILSLLLKPVSCFFVYQMYRERGGDYNVNFGKCVGNQRPSKLMYIINVHSYVTKAKKVVFLYLQYASCRIVQSGL